MKNMGILNSFFTQNYLPSSLKNHSHYNKQNNQKLDYVYPMDLINKKLSSKKGS